MMTYRTEGHVESETTFLPGSYRPEAEVESWRRRDPIDQLASKLRNLGLDEDALRQMQDEVAQEADSAFEFARESPMPDPATAMTDVFAEDSS